MRWNALKADVHREYGRFSIANLISGVISRRTFRVIFTMRLCQAAADLPQPLRFVVLTPLQVLHRLATSSAAMDLAWRTRIGAGLALPHGWGLVINPDVRIGNNVTLFHGVTLGRRDRFSAQGERFIEYPVLEDEVWVGPNAVIIGGVTVGKGSRILGGAYVTESVPPYSLVQGNPAAVVKENCTPDVMNPAPIYASSSANASAMSRPMIMGKKGRHPG